MTVWKKTGDAEANPGGNTKQKCPDAARITMKASGNAELQTSTQLCYTASG